MPQSLIPAVHTLTFTNGRHRFTPGMSALQAPGQAAWGCVYLDQSMRAAHSSLPMYSFVRFTRAKGPTSGRTM